MERVPLKMKVKGPDGKMYLINKEFAIHGSYVVILDTRDVYTNEGTKLGTLPKSLDLTNGLTAEDEIKKALKK